MFPSSNIYCPICHLTVALSDTDGKFILDKTGKPVKGWHRDCVKNNKEKLAVLLDENTGFSKTVNLNV